MKSKIEYSEMHVGMRVVDGDGNVGTIKECDDEHNILVEYDEGGSGLHCLVEGCTESSVINGATVNIPQYDPLYRIESRDSSVHDNSGRHDGGSVMYEKEKEICKYLNLDLGKDGEWVRAYYGPVTEPGGISGWQVVCHISKLWMYLTRLINEEHYNYNKHNEVRDSGQED